MHEINSVTSIKNEDLRRLNAGSLYAMIQKYLILLAIILLPLPVFAQADCIVFYKFKGSFERTEISDSSELVLEVPESGFFENFETEPTIRSKVEIDPHQNNFEKGFRSHLSSLFCRTKEELISDVFIGNNKFYPLILISKEGQKMIEKDINQINFRAVTDSGFAYIEINLGTLKW
mgnify:CR=1 FL=1